MAHLKHGLEAAVLQHAAEPGLKVRARGEALVQRQASCLAAAHMQDCVRNSVALHVAKKGGNVKDTGLPLGSRVRSLQRFLQQSNHRASSLDENFEGWTRTLKVGRESSGDARVGLKLHEIEAAAGLVVGAC